MSLKSLTEKLSKLGLSQPPFKHAASHPEHNVVDLMRNYITQELHRISDVPHDIIYQSLDSPNTLDKGDLIIPIPRLRLKGINPKEKAQEWSTAFELGQYLREVRAEGPFLQFFFSSTVLFALTIRAALGQNYGYLPLGEGKKVLVEFSSPNIAKPFHAGHLRSTIIGGFVSNLYEKCGWNVTRINYLGDWGKQYGVLAVGFSRYGSEEALEKDPINHLFEVYVKINNDMRKETEETGSSPTDDAARAYFKKMENGDAEALAMWKKFRELSIEKYIDTYARLNIVYDVYSGESQVSQESMKAATKTFEDKGLVHVDRGAKLIDLSKFNKHLGKCLVEKSDGTSLYLTRDVGEAIRRYEKYHFDKMIYVIASQQDLHTKQFFEILKQMGLPWADRLEHINFGMVEGMSTRKGTVVFLDHILEETKDKMHEVMKSNPTKYALVQEPDKVADLVGISAVMIQDMQAKRINNYTFKWERMLSFEGDTGPYLQYAHSRLMSVERNFKFEEGDSLEDADFSLITEQHGINLVRVLAQYPDTVARALKNAEPSTIVTYLFNVAHIVSQCYDVLWVAGQEKELALARLGLYVGARRVLGDGMRLLGLTPVERM